MVNYLIDDIFFSLSSHPRREILLHLSQAQLAQKELRFLNNDRERSQSGLTVSQIALPFKISLPAVSKHLKILEKAQLISRRKKGRQSHFTLTKGAVYWVKQVDIVNKFLKTN